MAFVGKFLKSIFLYFSFIEVFKDEKRIRLFLIALFASAFITSLSGAVQHYTGRDFLKGHVFGKENLVAIHRVNSTFFSANGFGAYLLPVIGLIAHLLYSAIGRKKSWGLGGAFGYFSGFITGMFVLDLFKKFLGRIFGHIVHHVMPGSTKNIVRGGFIIDLYFHLFAFVKQCQAYAFDQ